MTVFDLALLFVIITHLYSICFASRYFYDYAECEGVTNISDTDIYCDGAFSCDAAMQIESSGLGVYCQGSKACTNTNNMNITGTGRLYCDGSDSCSASNINAYQLFCEGTKSCMDSIITITNTIYGRGSFSLSNTTIISGNNDLSVTLNGYQAGFGAIIYCAANSVCTITCKSSGCLMVILKGAGTWHIITNYNGADRPITDPELYDESLLNAALLNDIIFGENICNQQESQWLFDGYRERYYGDDIMYNGANNTGSVCCRGGESCYGITNILMQNTMNDSIVCSGSWSCFQVSVINNTNGDIVCSGYWSCSGSEMISNNAVYCTAVYGCMYSNIMSGGNVYCSGYEACYGANISIVDNTNATIYFLGELSGYEVSIHCNEGASCSIFCGGADSCINIRWLRCDGECTVCCDEDTGCPSMYAQHTTSCSTIQPNIISTEALQQNPEITEMEMIYLLIGVCVVVIFLCLFGTYKYCKKQRSADSQIEIAQGLLEYVDKNTSTQQLQQDDNDANQQHTESVFTDHDNYVHLEICMDQQQLSNDLNVENIEYQQCEETENKEIESEKNVRKIIIHSENDSFEFIVCGDLDELDDPIYFELISSIRSYFKFPNNSPLSLYEKLDGRNLDVNDINDIIDAFEANIDDNYHMLHLYVINEMNELKMTQNKNEQYIKCQALENVNNIKVKRKLSDPLRNNECIVCMDNLCHYACIPCGHLCLCEKCKDLIDETCPICQSKCTSFNKIYK